MILLPNNWGSAIALIILPIYFVRNLLKKLDNYFTSKLEIPRIRVGKKQEIETLINEEALLFSKYLRNERKTWIPRIADLK